MPTPASHLHGRLLHVLDYVRIKGTVSREFLAVQERTVAVPVGGAAGGQRGGGGGDGPAQGAGPLLRGGQRTARLLQGGQREPQHRGTYPLHIQSLE